MQQADVAGVEIALERLCPVAFVKSLGCENVAFRQMRPFELRHAGRLARPHIRPDDAPEFTAWVANLFQPAGRTFARLVRHIYAIAGNIEFPAVIDAAQSM